MSGLPRQPVTWPLTGGLATKDSPLSQVPGTHLALINVRQERSDEWRPRFGYSRDTNDDLPGVVAPARIVETPGGGAIALSAEVGFASAGLSWVPSVSGSSRWNRSQTNDCSQSTPMVWSRRPSMTADTAVVTDYCEGTVYSLMASGGPSGASRGIAFTVSAKADGTHISDATFPGGVLNANGVRPRCILGPSDRLCLVWIDTGNTALMVSTWSGSTGANIGTTNVLGNGVTHATHFLDAWWYDGSNITIVFRTSTNLIRFLEYNPVTTAVATNVTFPVDCSDALSLLPDPDASGTRFVASSDAVDNTHVRRVSSAGAVLTNDTVVAARNTEITGLAYQAGASWMVVYKTATGGLSAVKKRGGAVSGVTVIVPSTLPYGLNSVAWREPGTDLMRFVAAIHGPTPDPQDSYFEMALAYDDGASVSNKFPEPQARLLPLNAGPSLNFVYGDALAHVQRIGTGQFVTGLCRIARFGFAATTAANQYAVDRWSVTYHPAGGLRSVNQGQGITTGDSAYLPVGSLLMTSDGKRIVSHGLCTIPLQPTLTPAVAAGSLTPGSTYQYGVIVEVPDENGKAWRSPMSLAASVALTPNPGGQNQVSVAVVISALELQGRVVTVKILRTAANGSLFRVINARTGTASALQSFTFVDGIADTAWASGDPLTAEAQATITPAFSHVAFWGNRMWGVDRDFPTRVWFSKPLTPQFQPEFPGAAFTITFDDEFGDITALSVLDDKLVPLKARARYVIQGAGPDNTGAGAFATDRIDSDWGCVVGGTAISTGSEVFTTTERGVWMMNKGLQAEYVGAGIDQWLNQPSLGASSDVPQQTILGGIYSSKTNEVRLLTADTSGSFFNPRQFVYDRIRGIWMTDSSQSVTGWSMTRVIGGRQAIITANGRMLFESTTQNVTLDDGLSYTSAISSAWIRPAGPEGRIRLSRARVLASEPIASPVASPTLVIYRDNDLTKFETFAPLTQLPDTLSANSTTIVRAEGRPRHRKCSTFLLQLILSGQVRLDKWAVEVAMKRGLQKLSEAQRWRSP